MVNKVADNDEMLTIYDECDGVRIRSRVPNTSPKYERVVGSIVAISVLVNAAKPKTCPPLAIAFHPDTGSG